MSRSSKRRIGNLVRSVLLLGLALVAAVPLYYIVVNSFKTQAEMSLGPLALPKEFSFGNYVDVFRETPIVRSFFNTLVVTAAGVGLMVLVGSCAAYGMIMRRSKFTALVGTILLIAFVIPGQATLIPLYRFEAHLSLVNTLSGLVLIYLSGSIFCYFLIVGYMRKLPNELFEAAKLDGATPFQIYWRIVLPLIKPMLITVVVFQTMWVWNDFLNPNVFISSSEKRTLVLQVYNAVGQFTTDWPLFLTLTVLTLLPIFLFFIFCQRWIVAGLTAGSIKG